MLCTFSLGGYLYFKNITYKFFFRGQHCCLHSVHITKCISYSSLCRTATAVGSALDLWCESLCVFTVLWYFLCFHFAGFDSTVSWAVEGWALQRVLHVCFYVCLKSCRGRYLRGLSNTSFECKPCAEHDGAHYVWAIYLHSNPGGFTVSPVPLKDTAWRLQTALDVPLMGQLTVC